MSIDISKEKPEIPFGVYRLNKDYIAFLKAEDDNVLDPKYTDRYCGPVFRVNSKRGFIDYFVPIDPVYDKMECVLITFKNGVIAGFMDAKRAIPCLEKNITRDDSDTGLSAACESLEAFIRDCSVNIHEKLTDKQMTFEMTNLQ